MGDRKCLQTSEIQKVRQALFNHFFRLVRHQADAEDLTQMALEKLLSAPDGTRVRNFRGYLWKVVRNVLMDFFRSKERDKKLIKNLESEAMVREALEFATDALTGDMRTLHQLEFLRNHMKESWWLATCLRLRDLSDGEIALRLGVSEPAVRKYLRKARVVINQLFRSH